MPTEEISVVTAWVLLLISAVCGAWVAATSCDTRELTLMTDPPAAAALEFAAMEVGPLFAATLLALVVAAVLVVMDPMLSESQARCRATHHRFSEVAGTCAVPANLLFPPGSVPRAYGSFCSSVRMFCGIVLAWATIAVEACCRIWALDKLEVAWA